MLSPTAPTPATASSAGNDPAGLAASAAQDLAADAARYRALQSDLVGLRDDLDRAAAAEDQARTAQVTAQAAVGDAAAELYRSTPEQQTPLLILDRNDPDAAATVIGLQVLADRADADRTAVVVRAERAGQAVTAAATRTAAAQLAVDSGVAEAQTVLTRIRATVAGLTPATSAQLASFGAVPSAADQQARNADALRRWQEYLATLDAAQIQPPAAAALADPDDLPPGFSPALDSSGAAIPGVAWAIADSRPVTVLPAETVVAVSVAFAALGRPYQADTAGPEAYDCGGLVAASWLQAGFGLPSVPVDQWTGGTAVPTAQLQVGDLVFADGGNDVAIYVGEGQVLGASGAAYQVGIRPLTASAGSVRVTLPGSGQPNPALPATNSGNGRCGTPPAPVGPVSPAWGGFANGRIPAAALCPIAPGHALRCDAAAQYTALAAAFAADFGRPLCITDSYRSYAAQLTASRVKPRLAAVPGTSNHGWALAVDLCGGINHAGSAEYRWMEAHAGRYGFVHPDWAQPGAEKPEPWHWEFGHLLDS